MFLFFCLMNVVLFTRLFYWQVIASEKLIGEGEKQYQNENIIVPIRGEIRTNDTVPLVSNQKAFLLYANPQKINKPVSEIAHLLSPVTIDIDPVWEASPPGQQIMKENDQKEIDRLEKQLSQSKLQWVLLKRKIDSSAFEKIKNLNIEGIGFQDEKKRLYTEGSTAAQLLGFVGSNTNGLDQGYFGLEGYYNNELQGREGKVITQKDASGKPIILAGMTYQDVQNGKSLILHIDRAIQYITEKKLKEAIEKYGAKGGSVVIMNPKDGGIVAMSNYPSYDPANWKYFDDTLYKNPLVADTFEPGSIFKTLIMASALNENSVKPDTKCDMCGGPRTINEYAIRTWNNKYYQNSTMIEILQHSDNVGMVFVGEKLGKDKLLTYLDSFGIGKKTGIDLQEETTSPLRPKSEWASIDLATLTFGQGIAVTGIQMIKAVSAIANEGKIYEPHIVDKIIDDNNEKVIPPKLIKQVIKPTTAKIMTEMMVNAVDLGEARFAKPKGYRIAGKTGTAQIPIAGHYDPTKTIASFIGFAPADDPKFIMLTIIREPSSSIWGSETAAPLFFSISSELFEYYNIAPTQ